MSVTSEIATMKNTTTYNKLASSTSSSSSTSTSSTNDSNTFLTLMLQEMQNQDPTQPMDNQQWLSQLAQYSSLEQMTAVNTNLKSLATSLESLSSNVASNSSINQTMSLVGKNVDIVDPTDSKKTITGDVSEATFDNGVGKIKVNGTYYPISNVQNIRNASSSSTTTTSGT